MRHGLDQVDQERSPLDVAQELVSQPVPGVAPFDQARDVGHDEVLVRGDHRPRLGYLVVNG